MTKLSILMGSRGVNPVSKCFLGNVNKEFYRIERTINMYSISATNRMRATPLEIINSNQSFRQIASGVLKREFGEKDERSI
jgi:hypothetical protein